MKLTVPSEQNKFYSEHLSIIARSYSHYVGSTMPLTEQVDGELDLVCARSLFNAPFALISHGTEHEPVFNYANARAMKLFNMSWDEITTLQSRYSAETLDREQRSLLLKEVKRHGYIENYSGVRIAKGGRRFYIEQATVWNLIDNGTYYGQAAMFSLWRFI